MKIFTVFFLSLFLTATLHSQTDAITNKTKSGKWAPGAIIRPDGTIEAGNIKIENEVDMQNYMTIKNGAGQNFTIYAKKLHGYYFLVNSDTVFYESIDGYTSDLFSYQFWRRILNDKITVYIYYASRSAGYVMMHEPDFLVKIDGVLKPILIDQYNYKKEMPNLFRNCADCFNITSKDPVKNIIDIFIAYNNFLKK